MTARRRSRAQLLRRLHGPVLRAQNAWIAIAQEAVVRRAEFAHFGARSSIHPPCHIVGHRYISIGDDVHIASGSLLAVQDEHNGVRYTPSLRIGSGTNFGSGLFVSCCGEIEIGDEVLGSMRVFIGDSHHDYRDPTRPTIRQPFAEPRAVRIGEGVFLGVGSCVLPGVTLGPRAYVAANAVVTDDVPELTLVAGVPARPIKRWDGRDWVAA